MLYVVRHYAFALNRLFGKQRNLYAEIIEAQWPTVTVLIPAHNEALVIEDAMQALINSDYPKELLEIIVLDDRSTDGTDKIIDDFIAAHPNQLKVFHRKEGFPGKSAALCDVLPLINHEIVIIFDADNIPGRFLIKQLVGPFFDPEVGAVMGRAVPGNTSKNLLTRLLDMERSAGYQVNQQARENLGMIPQYGGTAGGVRMRALKEIGGWSPTALSEDTEITFRLLCHGWKTVYQNNCECLEQVPESWPVRLNQIKRWAKGHNQVMFGYMFKVLLSKNLSLAAKLDGLLLLCLFLISPLLIFGWLLFILALYLNILSLSSGILIFFIVIAFSGAGNFSLFYEVTTAVHLDISRGQVGNRIRLLPLSYFNFFVSMFSLSLAFIQQITVDLIRKDFVWVKTERYRRDKSHG